MSQPRYIAEIPQIKAKIAENTGDIPEKPLLRPVAAESSELAIARAAASPAERVFELSVSAAVSSRYSLKMSGQPFSFSDSSPLSEICLTSERIRLLRMVTAPMKESTPAPAIRQISAEINAPRKPDSAVAAPRTAAQMKLMINADENGMRIELLQ